MARAEGLIVRPDVARRIAESCGGNRAMIEQELAKFALYVDASPDTPLPIDHDVLDALGAAADEGDMTRLVDSAGGGDAAALEAELARLARRGAGGDHRCIRAMLRRMTLLARLRAEVERGNSAECRHGVSRQVHCSGRRKTRSTRQLGRWRGRPDRQGDDPPARSRAAGEERSGGIGPHRRRRGIVRDLPPGGAAALELFPAQALADHVELIEAGISERDRPPSGCA